MHLAPVFERTFCGAVVFGLGDVGRDVVRGDGRFLEHHHLVAIGTLGECHRGAEEVLVRLRQFLNRNTFVHWSLLLNNSPT